MSLRGADNPQEPIERLPIVALSILKPKIGVYEKYGLDASKAVPLTEQQANARVLEILGKEGSDVLYKGCEESTEEREQYLEKLRDISLDLPEISPEKARLATEDSESGAISLEELFGDNIELYYKAMKEESESRAFRTAVIINSTKTYPDPKWDERMALFVVAPSGGGKSRAADAAVEKMATKLKKTVQPTSTDKNEVIFIDGGIERETSQVRQWAIDLAKKKGYTGISNIEPKSTVEYVKKYISGSVKMKKVIQKAAKASNRSVVIPDTGTKGNIPGDIEKYMKEDPSIKIGVCFVEPPPDEENHKDTVTRLGYGRAFVKYLFVRPTSQGDNLEECPPGTKDCYRINEPDLDEWNEYLEIENSSIEPKIHKIKRVNKDGVEEDIIVPAGLKAEQWLKHYQTNFLFDKDKPIIANNRNLQCESKPYSKSSYKKGKEAADKLKKAFLKATKNKGICLRVQNDVVFIKKDKDGNWVRCIPYNKKNGTGDKPSVGYRISKRDFTDWQSYRFNASKAGQAILSPQEWLRKEKRTSQRIIAEDYQLINSPDQVLNNFKKEVIDELEKMRQPGNKGLEATINYDINRIKQYKTSEEIINFIKIQSNFSSPIAYAEKYKQLYQQMSPRADGVNAAIFAMEQSSTSPPKGSGKAENLDEEDNEEIATLFQGNPAASPVAKLKPAIPTAKPADKPEPVIPKPVVLPVGPAANPKPHSIASPEEVLVAHPQTMFSSRPRARAQIAERTVSASGNSLAALKKYLAEPEAHNHPIEITKEHTSVKPSLTDFYSYDALELEITNPTLAGKPPEKYKAYAHETTPQSGLTFSIQTGLAREQSDYAIKEICRLAVFSAEPGTEFDPSVAKENQDVIRRELEKAVNEAIEKFPAKFASNPPKVKPNAARAAPGAF